MGGYARLADLPLRIDSVALEGLERAVAGGIRRLTTIVRLRGGGEEGAGEDVTYEPGDQEIFRERGAVHDLSGSMVLRELSERLDDLDLFPRRPRLPTSRFYRRWAFESAALDLALRQAGLSLGAALARRPSPVRFVVSMSLGDPPSVVPLLERLDRRPWLRFKLDATPAWDDALLEALARTGVVDCVDLKGHYAGTPVDGRPDAALYRRVAEALPGALIEDPALLPETDAALRPHRDRVTFDAPLHSVADIQALPFAPRAINVKPSRFGTIETLLEVYDFCAARGIGCYGGGQFELGPGRGQIQCLASLFHPDAPNDVAPAGYNDSDPPAGLPESPLEPGPEAPGFRFATP